MPDELPPLEERRAVYAAWRSSLSQRVERNRVIIDLRDEVPTPSDEWSADRLFEESRRLAAAESRA